tara:strand:- start:615 stop:1160 length:546 start_codon:yes stop_codon:yes gene_type:complete
MKIALAIAPIITMSQCNEEEFPLEVNLGEITATKLYGFENGARYSLDSPQLQPLSSSERTQTTLLVRKTEEGSYKAGFSLRTDLTVSMQRECPMPPQYGLEFFDLGYPWQERACFGIHWERSIDERLEAEASSPERALETVLFQTAAYLKDGYLQEKRAVKEGMRKQAIRTWPHCTISTEY